MLSSQYEKPKEEPLFVIALMIAVLGSWFFLFQG